MKKGTVVTIKKSPVQFYNGRWEIYNITLSGQMIHMARIGKPEIGRAAYYSLLDPSDPSSCPS